MNKVQQINFTPRATRALEISKQRCLENNYHEITEDFLLHAILFSESMVVNTVFSALNIHTKQVVIALSKTLPSNKKKLPSSDIPFGSVSAEVIKNSQIISEAFKQNYTGVEHIFLSLLRHSELVKKFLKKNSIDVGFLTDKTEKECKLISNPIKKPAPPQPDRTSNEILISSHCVDYNEKASKGEFDHISFREKEVEQMFEILCRKQKRNPMLIGDAGVGKSAVVGLIAKNIISCNCTEFLLNKKVLSLDLGALISGTKLRGEFEEKLVKIMTEIKAMGNVILFIDEIHNLIGLGNDAGQMDGANILKSYFTAEDLSFIGATTQQEYDKYFAKDSAMSRRFENVFVREPTKDETFGILKNVKSFYQTFHMIEYPNSVLMDIVNVCDKYMPDRRFPDKAIDLLDQIGAKVKIRGFARPDEIKNIEKLIMQFEKFAPDDVKRNHLPNLIRDYESKYDIWVEVAKKKKILAKKKDVYKALSDKLGKVIDSNSDNGGIKNIYSNLQKHVFGQDKALKKISDCILRSSFGLSKNSRPLGNFMFIGPTGSGKSHLARTLAKQAFGSDSNLCVIDMSEFMESHSVSKLIGAPPGYVGHNQVSVLTAHLTRHPSSVFLFDEIDKAHPDVVNVLLQIMDSGQLTTSGGEKLSFKNSIIIMTGNVGYQINDNKRMGFMAAAQSTPTKDTVLESLKKFFRPEFLARLNDIVIFDELSEESLIKVVESEFSQIQASLLESGTKVSFSPEVIDFILQKTKDSSTGARKIVFYVENEIKTKIVDILRANTYNKIKISIKDGELTINGKTKKLLATHSI